MNYLWQNHSIKFNKDDDYCEFLKEKGFKLEESNGFKILYPLRDSIVFVDDYIEKNSFFSIINYIKKIDFLNPIQVIFSSNPKKIENLNLSSENNIVNKILAKNNIISKHQIKKFSILLLKKINVQTNKIKKLRKIFFLILIANKTEVSGDGESISFHFYQDGISFKKKYELKEMDIDDIDAIDQIYDWILEDSYKNSYIQKIDIIRNLVLRNKPNDLLFEKTFLSASISVFQRIVKNETSKYFEQVNRLKDDFLIISKYENDIYQSLHLKILGWLSALGLTIFNQLNSYDGNNIFERLILSNSQKTKMILLMLLIGLLYIMIVYISEVRRSKVEYRRLKKFYTENFMFLAEDFDNKVSFPRFKLFYILFLAFLMLSTTLRFFLIGKTFIVSEIFLILIILFIVLLKANNTKENGISDNF
ncbi:hypothetical protein [Streptococcus zalophi]|uniref:Uncharacterized protein n=1 Tax=Streptococcus zalophi TaxID=640031 RepID=A0A934PB98_9STRE|nr:hypothetical protein [Streptococcus zalophi]MBJ8350195.1 hypothetical protein [Streptococcus zalophi]